MSGLQQLRKRLSSLAEIGDILDSLKTMALIETRRLVRYLEHQSAVVEAIRTPLQDLVHFNPTLDAWPEEAVRVLLVMGSERGFCGDFNSALVANLEGFEGPALVVGTRLSERLAGRPLTTFLPGPVTAEEVTRALVGLSQALTGLSRRGTFRLEALTHHPVELEVVRERVWPLPVGEQAQSFGYPPDLTLSPPQAFAELMEHYLLAVLQQLFYNSLMAENRRRSMHLEGALRHLEQKTAKLARRRNQLRQEEITNEMEVILMSAESLH
ncbi:MAG: FoF1 ATP synthase subunit gamma [Vulcanimicrobiota bacterium]